MASLNSLRIYYLFYLCLIIITIFEVNVKCVKISDGIKQVNRTGKLEKVEHGDDTNTQTRSNQMKSEVQEKTCGVKGCRENTQDKSKRLRRRQNHRNVGRHKSPGLRHDEQKAYQKTRHGSLHSRDVHRTNNNQNVQLDRKTGLPHGKLKERKATRVRNRNQRKGHNINVKTKNEHKAENSHNLNLNVDKIIKIEVPKNLNLGLPQIHGIKITQGKPNVQRTTHTRKRLLNHQPLSSDGKVKNSKLTSSRDSKHLNAEIKLPGSGFNKNIDTLHNLDRKFDNSHIDAKGVKIKGDSNDGNVNNGADRIDYIVKSGGGQVNTKSKSSHKDIVSERMHDDEKYHKDKSEKKKIPQRRNPSKYGHYHTRIHDRKQHDFKVPQRKIPDPHDSVQISPASDHFRKESYRNPSSDSQSDDYWRRQSPYYRRRYPSPRRRDPYGDRDPYARRRDPYARRRDPYGDRDPYARRRDPYARLRDPYARRRDPLRAPPGVARLEQRLHPSIQMSLTKLRNHIERVLYALKAKANRVNYEFENVYNTTRYDVMKTVRQQLKAIAEENDLAYDVVLDASQLVRYVYLRAHNHGLVAPAPRSHTQLGEMNVKDFSPDYRKMERMSHETRGTLRKVMSTKRVCMRQESRTSNMINNLKDRIPNRELEDIALISRHLITKQHADMTISLNKYRLRRYQYRYSGFESNVQHAKNLSYMSYDDLREAQRQFMQNKAYHARIISRIENNKREKRSVIVSKEELMLLSDRAYKHARNLQKVVEIVERHIVPLVAKAKLLTSGQTPSLVEAQINIIMGRVVNLIQKYERKFDEIKISLGDEDILRERCETLFETGDFNDMTTPIDCDQYGIYSGSGDLPVSTADPTTPPTTKIKPTTSSTTTTTRKPPEEITTTLEKSTTRTSTSATMSLPSITFSDTTIPRQTTNSPSTSLKTSPTTTTTKTTPPTTTASTTISPTTTKPPTTKASKTTTTPPTTTTPTTTIPTTTTPTTTTSKATTTMKTTHTTKSPTTTGKTIKTTSKPAPTLAATETTTLQTTTVSVVSTTSTTEDKEEGSGTGDFEFIDTDEETDKDATTPETTTEPDKKKEETGGGWWWEFRDDPLAGNRNSFREKLEESALANRTKSEEIYQTSEKVENRFQGILHRWNVFTTDLELNTKYVNLASSLLQSWADTEPYVKRVKPKIQKSYDDISKRMEKLNKTLPEMMLKANGTLQKLMHQNNSNGGNGINVIPELITAVDLIKNNMDSIKRVNIVQQFPCKTVENIATKLRTDIAELRKKIDRARDITTSMQFTVSMNGDRYAAVSLSDEKELSPTTSFQMCVKPSGTDMFVARFHDNETVSGLDNETTVYSVDIEESSPVMTVSSEKGDEYGQIRSTSTFDLSHWYNIRINRYGHTVEMITKQMDKEGSPNTTMALAVPELIPLQRSPVTVYIGGFPLQTNEDARTQFSGCIGEVTVNGKNIGLHSSGMKTDICKGQCPSSPASSAAMVFDGDGYVKFPLNLISSTYNMDNIQLNFTTRQKDGIIMLLNDRSQTFQVLISLTVGSLHVEARTKRGTTVLRSELDNYADGHTHGVILVFEFAHHKVEGVNNLKNVLSRTITKCIPNLTISGFIGDVHLVSHGKVFKEELRCPLPQVTRRPLALQHEQYGKITFDTDKIDVFTDGGIDQFTAETTTQEITSRLDNGIFLGGVGVKSQPLSGKAKLRSLIGCITHFVISDRPIPLFMMEESKNVHIGSCKDNIWTHCVWFTSDSTPIVLKDIKEADRLLLTVNSNSKGTALQYKKGSLFNIEISVTSDGISVIDVKEDVTEKIDNSLFHLKHWYNIEIADEDNEVKILFNGQKVAVSYSSGWLFNGDSPYTLTIGGTDESDDPYNGGISKLLINDNNIPLTQYVKDHKLEGCHKQPLETAETEILEKPIC